MINFRSSSNLILRQNPHNSNNQTSFKQSMPTINPRTLEEYTHSLDFWSSIAKKNPCNDRYNGIVAQLKKVGQKLFGAK